MSWWDEERGWTNRLITLARVALSAQSCWQITIDSVMVYIKDAFISAAERDTNTGDSILMKIVDKDGIHEKIFPLRRD